ncbi:hypothetical protein G6659_06115 [Polynucleobacter paneuropaeus]|nr:hypothetical protein G6659_06115 [Polynucleobacter paneuropaeus]
MKNINITTKKSQGSTHAFSTRKHPVFGRGGTYSEANPPAGVTRSPFYWWFKFLQLNDEYHNAVKGRQTKIPKQVVKDFGDVTKVDFKSWWKDRVHLFAEPQLNYPMRVATSIQEIAPFNDPQVINLVVPLNWTNVGIKRSFARVIDKLVPKEMRPKRVEGALPTKKLIKTEAEYRIGRKWSITGFEYAYKIYLVKKKSDLLVAQGGKKLPWADIAEEAQLPSYIQYKAGKTVYNETEIRRLLTILAKRHYERAEAYIKAASSMSFP